MAGDGCASVVNVLTSFVSLVHCRYANTQKNKLQNGPNALQYLHLVHFLHMWFSTRAKKEITAPRAISFIFNERPLLSFLESTSMPLSGGGGPVLCSVRLPLT